MATWHSINVNRNQVAASTARAVLVKFPNGSELKGYAFWHPAKLVREGRHREALSLSFTEGWQFSAFREAKGRGGRTDERRLDADDVAEAFGRTDSGIRSADDGGSYLRVTEPEPLDPVSAEVPDELLN